MNNKVWKLFEKELNDFEKVINPCLYQIARDIKKTDIVSITDEVLKSIKSDCVIIAWSFGGLIAMELSKRSSHVKAYVCICSAPWFVNRTDWMNVIDEKKIIKLFHDLKVDFVSAMNAFVHLVSRGDMNLKNTIRYLSNNVVEEQQKEVLLDWLQEFINKDERQQLKFINAPTLYVLAENDALINQEIINDIKSINSNIDINIIKNCGHAPFVSRSMELANQIKGFLNDRVY